MPGGLYHNQINNFLISKLFFTSVNIYRTILFPGAYIGSYHDMAMMTFRIHLKNPKKTNLFEINLILKSSNTQKLKTIVNKKLDKNYQNKM